MWSLPFNGNSKYGERGQETVAFSTNISVYLLNGTKWAHGYNGSLIGSHRDLITFDNLEWPWKAGLEGSCFRRIFAHNFYARIVWPTAIIFCMLNHARGGRVLGVNHAAVLRGVTIALSDFRERPTYVDTVWPRATKFGVVTHLHAFTVRRASATKDCDTDDQFFVPEHYAQMPLHYNNQSCKVTKLYTKQG